MTDNEILSKIERLGRGDRDSFPMAVYGLICKKDAELMMTNCKMYRLLGQADEKRLLQKIQQAKIEAYKEFAKQLRAQKGLFCSAESSELEYVEAVEFLKIENLLRELVGEDE